MPETVMPQIRRVTYGDHAQAAAEKLKPDRPGEAGLLAVEATRLAPLHAIQLNFDQVARQAEDRARGAPWPYDTPFGRHVADALAHAGHFRDVLRTATDAAESMITTMSDQLGALETAMSQEDPNEPPALTTTGEPHSLQQGEYDANADPGVPGNISDIEALHEGKATAAQAEALAAADTKDNTAEQPPKPTEQMQAERQAAAGGAGGGGAGQPPTAGDRPAAQAAPERPEPKKAPKR